MSYRALARTYRSRHFGELIGQDVLVKTLSNAIDKGRIHHAYMFTGVRGTGKTSTARIFAKAINYVGPDGKSGPTSGPTDDCPICVAIGEDRHPDVIEIDAASNRGIDDARQIIENVRYAPVEARYKVFIIDEVHMLTDQAFNALLKTLEEPPPHTVFIFATTEIRKVPVTILSRCQRFDLRRIDAPVLATHYKKIAAAEKIIIEDEAIHLIARAADGSARDGLSLLDQAIAQSGSDPITTQLIRNMLGRTDTDSMADLFRLMMTGDTSDALDLLQKLYNNGATPSALLDDLLEFTHLVTRIKITPDLVNDPGISQHSRQAAKGFADTFEISSLSRVWQMLLKTVNDLAYAPQPQQALEMAIIRTAFAAPMPPLEELLKKAPLTEQKTAEAKPVTPPPPPAARLTSVPVSNQGNSNVRAVSKPIPALTPIPELEPTAQAGLQIADFQSLVNLCEENNEPMLAADLFTNVRPVKFQQGQMQVNIQRGASKDLIGSLQKKLQEWTGQRWMIAVASTGGEPTLAEQQTSNKKMAIETAQNDPAVLAIKKILPHIAITDLKTE
jgi:DNA polymerase-3 subunit gamma/tau